MSDTIQLPKHFLGYLLDSLHDWQIQDDPVLLKQQIAGMYETLTGQINESHSKASIVVRDEEILEYANATSTYLDLSGSPLRNEDLFTGILIGARWNQDKIAE